MVELGKDIFMRARAGNINISFQSEDEAKEWTERLTQKLEENQYKVKKM